MLPLIVRFLLVFLTLAMLVGALVQGAGRLLFKVLDRIEPAVNEVLSVQGMQATGLHGDWRLLNPIVEIDRLDLPAGQVADVWFELDTLRSLLFSRVVVRRLRVGNLDLTLEKPDDEPWRLLGASGGGFDVLRFLQESGQLELSGTLAFTRSGYPSSAIRLSYLGINRGGEHRHRLEAWNSGRDCESPCRLLVDFHEKEGIWRLREWQQRVVASATNFALPRALLALSALRIDALDLAWRREDEASGGSLALAAAQVGLPSGSALSAELQGAVRGIGDEYQGSLSRSQIRRGDQVWSLPLIALRGDGDVVQAWIEALDLGTAADFLEGALSGIEPAAQWLAALDVRGQAHDLRGYLRLPTLEYGYAATVDGIAMEGFKGVPYIRNGAAEVLGYARGAQLDLNAEEVELQFPDVFTERWPLTYAQGRVKAWFRPGYLGLRGLNVRAETGGSHAVGGFALSRPPAQMNQSLTLQLGVDGIDVDQARKFLPYKLPQRLLDWVEVAPREGYIRKARFAYEGQLKVEPGELARRVAFSGDVTGVRVRYHPDWPEVRSLNGRLDVAGSTVTVAVAEAESAGILLSGTQVVLTDNAAAADIALDADLDAGAALDFARFTPLREWLAFLQPDWSAAGSLRLQGDLHIPIARLAGGRSTDQSEAGGTPDNIAVRLRADLGEVDVDLPGYRLSLADLTGSLRYRYPYTLQADGVTGKLFGEPVKLDAVTRDRSVHLVLSGRATPRDVWSLTKLSDPGFAAGSFAYQADLGIGTTQEVVTQLQVTADLAGLALDLPGPYAKDQAETLPLALNLQFLPDYNVLSGRYRDVSAWLHFADTPLRGAVGFGRPAPTVMSSRSLLVLSGHVPYFALDDVLPDDGSGSDLPLPLQLQKLTSDAIGVGGFTITNAGIEGEVGAGGFELTLASDNVTGTFTRGGDGPLVVNLREFVVPEADTPAGDPADGAAPNPDAVIPAGGVERDPLSPAIIRDLPVADVVVERLMLGGGDYGSWSFKMRPDGGNLRVTDLSAQVRGVQIDAPDGLTWRGDSNETRFVGELRGGDLSDVLPQWGYAPHLETKAALVSASFVWPGSPAAVDMLALNGEATVQAEHGRFLEVESGGGTLAIFSLLNFTAIAKRMSLDFSDVSGKGVSFDRLQAHILLDAGELSFVEPMEVDGTGSNFRIAGSVNLNTGLLDNEMIVTLPVSKSLPWYGAYIALANPIAGLGVLVGERVLRKPLEQFSSARYEIGGTLENPQVKLVSVFGTSMSEPNEAEAGAPEVDSTEADGAEAELPEAPAADIPVTQAPVRQPEPPTATVTDD